jgi:hypothetical protein
LQVEKRPDGVECPRRQALSLVESDHDAAISSDVRS